MHLHPTAAQRAGHRASSRLAPSLALALTSTLALASALAGTPALAQGAPSRFEVAQADYEDGRYERAFTQFARLADEGHCEAARIAQQMLRFGKGLYAIEFPAEPERIERWRHMPACPAALARR